VKSSFESRPRGVLLLDSLGSKLKLVTGSRGVHLDNSQAFSSQNFGNIFRGTELTVNRRWQICTYARSFCRVSTDFVSNSRPFLLNVMKFTESSLFKVLLHLEW
jgi:hypothetical protein